MSRSILAHPERRFLIEAIGAALLATFIDNWAAPALHNQSPFWALGFLLALILRKQPGDDPAKHGVATLGWSLPRAALFILLHAGIIALGRSAGETLTRAASQTTLGAGAIASLKLLVLAPTLALFPPSHWKRLGRAYAAELVAATLVLFTWNPSRLFETVWPQYSEWLGRLVYAVGGLFVAGLAYVPGAAPTLTGPELDVSILFACSGLNGVKLFQILFGVMLLVDWNQVKKVRALAAYFAGLAAMLIANALRIALLVVLGNRVSANLVARFHIDAGWIFFVTIFLVLLAISYRWLIRPNPAAPRAVE